MGFSSAVSIFPNQPFPISFSPAHNQWDRIISGLDRFFTYLTNAAGE
jgi:hypothetical protein